MLESELFALLQRTTDAAFSVTEEGEIVSWNKAAERLFGYSFAGLFWSAATLTLTRRVLRHREI